MGRVGCEGLICARLRISGVFGLNPPGSERVVLAVLAGRLRRSRGVTKTDVTPPFQTFFRLIWMLWASTCSKLDCATRLGF